ncbi:acyl carrier protein [Micromonospora sp. NPDC051300]|uniref:acyl carrier protein n=1 Tax=Micromonospora sp. NPDC051300 TaxID=3364286 RepID=UPI0037AA244A
MSDPTTSTATEPDLENLHVWVRHCAASFVRREPGDIDPAVPLSSYGLDSVAAVSMMVELENHLGFELDPNLMWDHPTVDALTEALRKEATARR